MKATDVIKRDHKAAKALFAKYKKANEEDRAAMEGKVFGALTQHEAMEDEHFYPALREAGVEDSFALSEIEREQTKLEEEVSAAQAMTDDRNERILSIMDTVLAHAKREETEILPAAEKALGAKELEKLGGKMEPESAVANEE